MSDNKRKGIPAAAFLAALSSAGRGDGTLGDRGEKLIEKFTVVERWDGQKWIEVRLEWDGTAYKEIQ
jgi:hypothetical protein